MPAGVRVEGREVRGMCCGMDRLSLCSGVNRDLGSGAVNSEKTPAVAMHSEE